MIESQKYLDNDGFEQMMKRRLDIIIDKTITHSDLCLLDTSHRPKMLGYSNKTWRMPKWAKPVFNFIYVVFMFFSLNEVITVTKNKIKSGFRSS